MKVSNPNQNNYNLNVRVLLKDKASNEQAKEIRDLISKTLHAKGHDVLVWEQPKAKNL